MVAQRARFLSPPTPFGTSLSGTRGIHPDQSTSGGAASAQNFHGVPSLLHANHRDGVGKRLPRTRKGQPRVANQATNAKHSHRTRSTRHHTSAASQRFSGGSLRRFHHVRLRPPDSSHQGLSKHPHVSSQPPSRRLQPRESTQRRYRHPPPHAPTSTGAVYCTRGREMRPFKQP